MSNIKKVIVNGRERHISGFKKQAYDIRDTLYHFRSTPALVGAANVTSYNLLQYNLPVVDQLTIGSCASCAFTGIAGINENVAKKIKTQKPIEAGYPQATLTPNITSKVQLSTDGKTLSFSGTITNFITPQPVPVTTTQTPVTTPAPVHTTTPVPVTTQAPITTPAPTPAPTAPILASRLYEYYNARALEGTTNEDSGSTIRDVIKAAAQYGVAHESLWPYDITKFEVKPPQSVYNEAASHLVVSYHSIADGDLASIKAAILSNYGVEFGFSVYDSFLSDTVANTGIVPMPNINTETLQGGHGVCAIGFDDVTQMFLIRNSWGTEWGLLQTGSKAPIFGGVSLTAPGYFLMPYAYVGNTSLASDFWVVVSNVLNS